MSLSRGLKVEATPILETTWPFYYYIIFILANYGGRCRDTDGGYYSRWRWWSEECGWLRRNSICRISQKLWLCPIFPPFIWNHLLVLVIFTMHTIIHYHNFPLTVVEGVGGLSIVVYDVSGWPVSFVISFIVFSNTI